MRYLLAAVFIVVLSGTLPAGEEKSVFADLEQAIRERVVWLPFVTRYPDLKPLRADPRFETLRARIRLR